MIFTTLPGEVPFEIEVGVFSPLLMIGRLGDDVALEGVVFFRTEVLDDIMPLALGFVGRPPVDVTICSALLANQTGTEIKRK